MIHFLVFQISRNFKCKRQDIQVIGHTISGVRDFINNIRIMLYFLKKTEFCHNSYVQFTEHVIYATCILTNNDLLDSITTLDKT